MPVVDLNEAHDVDLALERVLSSTNLGQALQHLRSLFVELLDFEPAANTISVRGERLPRHATRVAQRDGVQVVAN
jgi:hypothetical protein